MRTVVCLSPRDIKMVSKPRPVPVKGEALVRVRRVGVCAADLAVYRGTQPFLTYPKVIGQDLAGEVVKAPARSDFAVGDPVYVLPYLTCGNCMACSQGKSNCCPHIDVLGVHRDGGMAEYIVVPVRFLVKTEGLPLDDAALLGGLAIGAHAVRRSGLAAGQRALVVGAGPIGMATALFARLKGAEVSVLDGRAERLAFCRERLGIPNVFARGPSDHEQLADSSADEFFDAVFDASGNPAAREQGLPWVANGGALVLVSNAAGRIGFSAHEFHEREIRLIASRHATPDDFREAAKAIRDGHVPTRAMVSHRTTLAGLPALLQSWDDPGHAVLKAMVEI